MLTPRHSFAAVPYQGSIYVIGGQCSDHASSALQSVEIYDYYFGAWSYVGEMGIARSRHSACVLDGKIFVVGGQDENPNIVREIECYNGPLNDSWIVVGWIGEKLVDNSVVVVY